MEEEVRRALLAGGYRHEEIRLETTPSGNVGGFVISERFAGQEQMERQDALWRVLQDHLDEATQQHIVVILTMTPAEEADDPLVANG